MTATATAAAVATPCGRRPDRPVRCTEGTELAARGRRVRRPMTSATEASAAAIRQGGWVWPECTTVIHFNSIQFNSIQFNSIQCIQLNLNSTQSNSNDSV